MVKNPSKETFEKKLERLEEISNLLEDENIGIEESIKLYEEGVKLSKICLKTLNEAELKISELKKELNSLTNGNVKELKNNPDGEF